MRKAVMLICPVIFVDTVYVLIVSRMNAAPLHEELPPYKQGFNYPCLPTPRVTSIINLLVADPLKYASPHMFYRAVPDRCWSNGMIVRRQNCAPCIPPFNDT